jgi:flagellar basal-body rod protein FlgF
MENSIYVGLSRQVVLQSQMDMVANNIANLSTPGYRGQNLLFKEYVADPKGQDHPYSMVYDYGQYTSTRAGVTSNTGAPLDVALQGSGFFTITTPQGPRYTRAGNFSLNAKGEIVTSTGDIVGNGSAVVIPRDAQEIHIGEDGTVSTENGAIGRLEIVQFTNDNQLTREGNGLYNANGAAPGPANDTRAMQGMLEGSNVEGVTEITKMIGILRDYQSVQKLLQSEHELQQTAIQRLTQRSA